MQSIFLADHAGPQSVFHAQQFLALAFEHFIDRDAGPFAHHTGNMIRADDFRDKPVISVSVFAAFHIGDPLFEIWNSRKFKFGGFLQIANALGFGHFGISAVQLFFGRGGTFQFVLFSRPRCGQLIRLGLQLSDFAFNRLTTIFGGSIFFFLQRFRFDFELQEAPVNLVQFFRFGIDLHAQARGRFIHQIDRLIRQEPISNIAIGQGRC